MMHGKLAGVFGSDFQLCTEFMKAQGKKHEDEGMVIYQRQQGESMYNFLSASNYPEKISTFARIASIVHHAFFIIPRYGKIGSTEGELALLLDSLRLDGTLVVMDDVAEEKQVKGLLKGSIAENYKFERFEGRPSIRFEDENYQDFEASLVWTDKGFEVKGLGPVLLGFILSGELSLHQKVIALPMQKEAEIRNIQVNDVVYQTVGIGTRAGFSMKGIGVNEVKKVMWLTDNEAFTQLNASFRQNRFYKQQVSGREFHLCTAGEDILCNVNLDSDGKEASIVLKTPIPAWNGQKYCILKFSAEGSRRRQLHPMNSSFTFIRMPLVASLSTKDLYLSP